MASDIFGPSSALCYTASINRTCRSRCEDVRSKLPRAQGNLGWRHQQSPPESWRDVGGCTILIHLGVRALHVAQLHRGLPTADCGTREVVKPSQLRRGVFNYLAFAVPRVGRWEASRSPAGLKLGSATRSQAIQETCCRCFDVAEGVLLFFVD